MKTEVKKREKLKSAVDRLINWSELSRTLCGKSMSLSSTRYPKKHAEAIDQLRDKIVEWEEEQGIVQQ